MRIDQDTHLKQWFDGYSRSYLTGRPEQDSPLTVKIEHTVRVCGTIGRLARSIGMGEEATTLAEAIGLLHDIGRFEQYRRYGTFNDHQSANHASIGIGVLRETAAVDFLAATEQEILIDAIRFHNTRVLPGNRPSGSQVFMRLIRDADKLDIWRVFAEHYRHPRHLNPTITQNLPDLPVWDQTILEAIDAKRIARLKDMKSLNDYKLIQLSWVFDLNFPETYVCARERGDLMAIALTLPDDARIHQAISTVMNHLAQGCSDEPAAHR